MTDSEKLRRLADWLDANPIQRLSPWCRLLEAAKAVSSELECSSSGASLQLYDAIKALDPDWEG
jgi:hypothetical protein